MLALLAGLWSPSSSPPSVANMWASNVWGRHVWGRHVWAADASSTTGVANLWGANVWGPHVWGAHVWASSSGLSGVVGKYKAEHDAALADLIAAGASPITFARWSASAASAIAGAAMQVKGDPERYAAKGLVLSNTLTLLFCPTIYGYRAYTSEFVSPGDVVVWNGVSVTVKDVETVAPDGIVIIARIVAG